MPFAVTHILFPIIVISLFKEITNKGKKITRRMIIAAGIFGLLPDIDIPVFLILSQFTSIPITSVHRTITHSYLIPLIGLIVAAAIYFLLKKNKAYMYALLFAFGTFTHITLDLIVNGTIMPFYPIINIKMGFDLLSLIVPNSVLESDIPYRLTLMASLDALLLLTWLFQTERKKR